jgi:hypothetical protein
MESSGDNNDESGLLSEPSDEMESSGDNKEEAGDNNDESGLLSESIVTEARPYLPSTETFDSVLDSSTSNDCPPGEVRDPIDGFCVPGGSPPSGERPADCPPGGVLDPIDGFCVPQTPTKEQSPTGMVPVNCPDDQVRDAIDGFCVPKTLTGEEPSVIVPPGSPSNDCPPGEVRDPMDSSCLLSAAESGQPLKSFDKFTLEETSTYPFVSGTNFKNNSCNNFMITFDKNNVGSDFDCGSMLFTPPPLEGEIEGGPGDDVCILICPSPDAPGDPTGGTPAPPPQSSGTSDEGQSSDKEKFSNEYCKPFGLSEHDCNNVWRHLICGDWQEPYCTASSYLPEGCQVVIGWGVNLRCDPSSSDCPFRPITTNDCGDGSRPNSDGNPSSPGPSVATPPQVTPNSGICKVNPELCSSYSHATGDTSSSASTIGSNSLCTNPSEPLQCSASKDGWYRDPHDATRYCNATTKKCVDLGPGYPQSWNNDQGCRDFTNPHCKLVVDPTDPSNTDKWRLVDERCVDKGLHGESCRGYLEDLDIPRIDISEVCVSRIGYIGNGCTAP